MLALRVQNCEIGAGKRRSGGGPSGGESLLSFLPLCGTQAKVASSNELKPFFVSHGRTPLRKSGEFFIPPSGGLIKGKDALLVL